ncbi:MAG: Rrf2 family transcriptional regulator [Pseudomonadota bacterium]
MTVLSDYSLRVLMYLAARPERRATIQEVAEAYAISENHLMKVVHGLAKVGLVKTVRGRGGGLCLARDASRITIGQVLRAVEEDFDLVECLGEDDRCRITSVCRLKRVLKRALDAYLGELDNWTLAEVVGRPKVLLGALGIEATVPR